MRKPLTKYNVLGTMCYRLWSLKTKSWQCVPVKLVARAGGPAALGYSVYSPFTYQFRAIARR